MGLNINNYTPKAREFKNPLTELHVSLKDLQVAKELAFYDPSKDQQILMRQQRNELHQKSKKTVESWQNTFQGKRKVRLMAAQNRAAEEELERVRIDKEWQAIKAIENQHAVDNAKLLQRLEMPLYRDLHSQIVLANTIQERGLQIELKKLRNKPKEINDPRIEPENPFVPKKVETWKIEQKKHAERLKVAEYQKNQHTQRSQAAKLEQIEETKRCAELNNKLQESINNYKNDKPQKQENLKKELDLLLAEKEIIRQNNLEQERKLSENITKFVKQKDYTSQKHKEFLKNQSNEKNAIYDKICNLGLEEDNARIKLHNDYIQKEFLKKLNSPDDRVSKEKMKRNTVIKEIEDFRRKKLELKNLEQQKEREDVLRMRKIINEQKEEFEQEAMQKAKKKRDINNFFRDCQTLQINEKKDLEKKNLDLSRKKVKGDSIQKERENEEFNNYINSFIKEWQAEGKDTRLISRYLERTQEKKIVDKGEAYRIQNDSFKRLGFAIDPISK